MQQAIDAGVRRESIVLDPGLGFAKRAEHTYTALADFDRLAGLDRPILSGPSRKSFLTSGTGRAPADRAGLGHGGRRHRQHPQGAHIIRVHNVPAMRDVARVADRIGAGAGMRTAAGPTEGRRSCDPCRPAGRAATADCDWRPPTGDCRLG